MGGPSRTSSRGRARIHRIAGLLAAVALACVAAGASPAAADSFRGCAYPRVCFYLSASDWQASRPTAAYQDVTSSYQNLGSRSRGADWMTNTRNDDRVWVRYVVNATGAVVYECIPPNTSLYVPSAFTLTGVKIEWASACP
ncbi:hypothetical protein [Mumia sp. DW29H23]|uniref:hypothetical protein n=1 Tax=Mumia sp. DW29H23 TaxID=3421241 RepID=UPI003D692C6F